MVGMLDTPLTTDERAIAKDIAHRAQVTLPRKVTFADLAGLPVEDPALVEARNAAVVAVSSRVCGDVAGSIRFRDADDPPRPYYGSLSERFYAQGIEINGSCGRSAERASSHLQSARFYIDLFDGNGTTHAFTTWDGHWSKTSEPKYRGWYHAKNDPRWLYGHLAEGDQPKNPTRAFADRIRLLLAQHLDGESAVTMGMFDVHVYVKRAADRSKADTLIEASSRNVILKALGLPLIMVPAAA